MKTKTRMIPFADVLTWKSGDAGKGYAEAIVGDFENADGVLFTLERYPNHTYRLRGSWRLVMLGCIDEKSYPTRWYHSQFSAKSEAEAIAKILRKDRNYK